MPNAFCERHESSAQLMGFLSPCQAQNPHEIPSQLQDHTAIMSSEQGLLKARVPEKKTT